MHHAHYKFGGLNIMGLLALGGRRVLLSVIIVTLVTTIACPVQAATALKQGSTLPIYLQAEALAEAEKPSLEVASDLVGYWNPGTERLYGYALRDLRDYLQKMTGAQIPFTVADANAKSGIFAGTFAQFPDFKPQQAEAQKAMASADPEAFVIEAQGDRLFILGKTNFGLIAGIYTLLDKLGVKWFAPGQQWENVPQLNELALDNKLNISSSGPTFKARLSFSSFGPNSSVFKKGERDAEYTLWHLRNRMGGSAYTADYHNSPILPVELFKTRPELFASVKGKRIPEELDRDNPEAVKMAIEIAVKYLKDNEGKGSFYNSFSAETGDGVPGDEEGIAKFGNKTDLDFWFANQIAAGIEKAGLKDKWVGMYSYSDHAAIPSFDLHPKVGVMITNGLDFSSGLTVEQRLDGFRKRKAQRLGIYDYFNLVTWSLDKPGSSPASDPMLVAANLKRWREHGANVFMAETSDSWISGGPGHYLLSRLLWDINTDPDQVLDSYYQGAFGPAARPIRALYEDWVKYAARNKGNMPKMVPTKLARWHQWISEADQLVQGQPKYRARMNDVKRYFMYLKLTGDYEGIADTKPPSKEKQEAFVRMMRYVGSNRGEGAFHAKGVFLAYLLNAPTAGFDVEKLGPEFGALYKLWNDEAGWKTFAPVSDAEIDKRFSEVQLPVGAGVQVFPANVTAPAEINFPRLHGPPGVSRNYVLNVLAPTPKLTLKIAPSTLQGGSEERSVIVSDATETEIKSLKFKSGEPVTLELSDVKPGFYTVSFPEFGSEQLTVSGGNTLGAMLAPADNWGFNPFRLTDKEGAKAYFLVPAGVSSLKMRLAEGTASIKFVDGAVIAPEVTGAANKPAEEFKFVASDKPRIAVVEWGAGFMNSVGMHIEGVTLYSPDPSYVLYGSLD